MPKIVELKCSLCGQAHTYSGVRELLREGWFAGGVTQTGQFAKRLICPTCLERIVGRRIQPHELVMPD